MASLPGQCDDAVIHWPEVETFKADARSRVWRVARNGQQWVIKRFDYNRVKQWFSAALGLHPGQCERRQAEALGTLGLPVVPLSRLIWHGGRLHIVTPFVGQSLQRSIAEGLLHDPRGRRHVAEQLAEHLALFVEHGYFLRDYQVANLVQDAAGRLWLIDTGGARRSRSPAHTLRMMRQLLHTMRVEGASTFDCARVVRQFNRATGRGRRLSDSGGFARQALRR